MLKLSCPHSFKYTENVSLTAGKRALYFFFFDGIPSIHSIPKQKSQLYLISCPPMILHFFSVRNLFKLQPKIKIHKSRSSYQWTLSRESKIKFCFVFFSSFSFYFVFLFFPVCLFSFPRFPFCFSHLAVRVLVKRKKKFTSLSVSLSIWLSNWYTTADLSRIQKHW